MLVSDYDATWPIMFERISKTIRPVIADLGATVDHVGSTAVPGLAAKPVIDIDVVADTVEHVPLVIERLQPLGYIHEGNLGVDGREAFISPDDAPAHHLYLVVRGNQAHRRHLRSVTTCATIPRPRSSTQS